MAKLVIDTNVFISAMLSNGYSKLIVENIFSDDFHTLCYSNESLLEIERVVNYPHLTKRKEFPERAQIILENIKIFGTQYFPTRKIAFLKDLSDNKFLELAIAAKADFLITGNHLDFNMDQFENVKVLNPKSFWEYMNIHG